MFKPSIAQAALAMVWLYQGLWCKLLGRAPRHRAIAESVPHLPRMAFPALGAAECLLALWILSGTHPQLAAAAQTILLAAMNLGGIVWAAREIPDIPGMLLLNFAFVTLAWSTAYAH